MKKLEYIYKTSDFPIEHLEELLPEDSLLFDIETTGFKADYQSIYLIGYGFRKKNDIVLTLLYARTPEEEGEILKEFYSAASFYPKFISFNGDMFDIPFLNKRYDKNSLPSPFHGKASTDLFKIAKRYKRFLNLPHYKQKDLENYFGLFRKDQFNGGQLIELYKKQKSAPNAQEEDLLFLHNLEDVKGMLYLLKLFDFSILDNDSFTINSGEICENELLFEGTFPMTLNLNLNLIKENGFIQIKNNQISGNIKLFRGKLKYYYKDYKNYIFVPDENLLLPKSLSSTIDKSRITKATKEQCYVEKEGIFIKNLLHGDEREFKKDINDKESYVELLQDKVSTAFLHAYISKLLH